LNRLKADSNFKLDEAALAELTPAPAVPGALGPGHPPMGGMTGPAGPLRPPLSRPPPSATPPQTK
ncbi:MAG TPA: hypothetical protein VGG91_14820, partial [Myxococcaceae bacterium]